MNLFYYDKIVILILLFFLVIDNKDNISEFYTYKKIILKIKI